MDDYRKQVNDRIGKMIDRTEYFEFRNDVLTNFARETKLHYLETLIRKKATMESVTALKADVISMRTFLDS